MAEQPHEAKTAAGKENDGHGEKHAPQPFDALHHILDYPVCGISTNGKLVFYPIDSHTGAPKPFRDMQTGEPLVDKKTGKPLVYEAATIGPFKLEFTRYMQDLTIVAALLAAVIVLIAKRVTHNVQYNETTKGPLANAVEAMVLFIRDEIVKPVGGKHVLPYTPLILTYFFFIMACNYSGMVPWFFNGATASVSASSGTSTPLVRCRMVRRRRWRQRCVRPLISRPPEAAVSLHPITPSTTVFQWRISGPCFRLGPNTGKSSTNPLARYTLLAQRDQVHL